MEIHFYPFDFEYKLLHGKTYFYLYGKTIEGERICVITHCQPYFYARVRDVDREALILRLKELKLEGRPEPALVTGWEEAEKELLGKKEKLLKIFVNYPKAVPPISRELQSWGIECYEKDILFVHRCLRDLNIVPMTLVQAIGEIAPESDLRVPVFEAVSLKQISLEISKKLRLLALDIETYAQDKIIDFEKNPILMLAFYGIDENDHEFKKVITWKHFKHDLNYLEIVSDEVELLKRFKEVILKLKPDVITGYFSDGFDLPYLKHRAEKHKVKLDLGWDYSSLEAGGKADFREGDSKITGYLHLDVCKFIRYIFGRNLKTDSYTLDAVAEELLGHKKHIVNLDNLAHVWDHNLDELNDFCQYNLHDAHLTLQLCQKLLFDMIEFTKIVGLPTNDVIRMRFSRLVESYILKRAMEFNVLAPNKPEHEEVDQRMEETYQGAFVYEPIPGLYKDIIVFDFRSLYPSIITTHNIGPESFHCSCCKSVKEARVPTQDEYWFCVKSKKFIPEVLEHLILIRADLKKQIREAKLRKENTTLLEARSWAIKTLANSFYGYLGFFGARWYCIECARSTTAYARNYIRIAMNKAEETGFKVIYGDSLTPDRKIFIKNEKGEVNLVNLGEFVDKNLNSLTISKYQTLSYSHGKLVFSPILRGIRHDYNSQEKGQILKIVTAHGMTKITPQHSVYLYDQKKLKLVDASTIKGSDLLISLSQVPSYEKHKDGEIFDLAELDFGLIEKEICLYTDNLQFPNKKGKCPYCSQEVNLSNHVFSKHQDRRVIKSKKVDSKYCWVGTKHAEGGKIPRYWKLTTELAWVLGYYCAEGSVSDIKTKKGSKKSILSFGSQDKDQMERLKRFFDPLLNENLKIIIDFDKRINKEMYYYRIQRRPIIGLFETGFGCGKGSSGKKVPSFIYTAEEKVRRAFLEGYLEGDGTKHTDKRYKTHFIRCDTNSKDLACGLDYLFKSISQGFDYFGREVNQVGWKYRSDKPLVSSLRVQGVKKKEWSKGCLCAARIREILPEDYFGPVYDLEVEGSHNFVDAEGLILVHNTDSMFVLLGDQPMDKALHFQKEINAHLPGQMELELENYYPRGIFVASKGSVDKGAKKRYALISKEGKLKITGFEMVRRNSSLIAKEVQEQILRMILEDKVKEALNYAQKIIVDLKSCKVGLDKLIIRTQITKELKEYSSIAPHVAIAWQLVKKGERIAPGSVVQYVICRGSGLVRDRAKLPLEAKDYDAEYYLNNQVLPAISSIFAVLGYSEADLVGKSAQTGLGKFF